MSSSGKKCLVSSYIGIDAELAIDVGFQPSAVQILNMTTASSAVKTQHMAGETYLLVTTAAAVSGGSAGTGILLSSTGFTVGTNDDINDADDEFHFIAWE
mgnify:CR=1 FL=1